MASQKYEYSVITDLQMESFAKAYKKIDSLAQKALRTQNMNDKKIAEAAIKIEIDKIFPKGYPVPEIDLFKDDQTTLVAAYKLKENRIGINLSFPPAQQASFAIHEIEHVIQAKKIADYIASSIATPGKPVTSQSIIAASTASASITDKDSRGEPLSVNNITRQKQVSQYISQSVADEAARDYNSGKRLNLGQITEAKKLKESILSSKGILNRDRLQTAINQANAKGSSADVKRAIENYRIGIFEEGSAYKIQERFDRIWEKVENQRTRVSSEKTLNPIASVTPLKTANEQAPTASIAQKRAEAITLQLREYGISKENAPEFEAAFIGVLNNLKTISIDEKQDIAKLQDLNANKLTDPSKDAQREM